MSTLIPGNRLGLALLDEGLLPANANLIEVLVPASGVTSIRYTVFLTEEDIPKLARALVKAGEAPRKATGA